VFFQPLRVCICGCCIFSAAQREDDAISVVAKHSAGIFIIILLSQRNNAAINIL
jgi:hypothetical protein